MWQRQLRRWAVPVAGALVVSAPGLAHLADPARPGDGPGRAPAGQAAPELLRHPGHGPAVVDRLGDRLDDVARANGRSPAALRGLLRRDRALWVDQGGRLFYVEPPATAAEAATGDTGDTAVPAPSTAQAVAPLRQTFALHSRPDSSHTIFLDLDGGAVVDTVWNAERGLGTDSLPPFSSDASPSFSDAEKRLVQKIWSTVAEDYAPFDVDVTTEDPGPDALVRSSTSDEEYGVRALVSPSEATRALVCGTCTGIAYVDVFDMPVSSWAGPGYYQPALVFPHPLDNNPTLVGSTVSHEVGHMLGLDHDGLTSGADYASGHGFWAPIMGYGARAVAQFSAGEYEGANNTQDDLAVIADHGIPLLPDDHPDRPAGATPLPAASPAADGVIGTRADVDAFAWDRTGCTGPGTVTLTPTSASPDVDLRLRLLGPDGGRVATADPPARRSDGAVRGLDASLGRTLDAGAYTLLVDGVGFGDPVTTGWSDYASLGRYHLEATGCDTGTTDPTDPSGPTATEPSAPGRPAIRRARPGDRGGRTTASVRWAAAASDGGARVSGYRVQALRLDSAGRVLRRVTASRSAGTRTATLRLARGRYAFRVAAVNSIGQGGFSARSATVRAR